MPQPRRVVDSLWAKRLFALAAASLCALLTIPPASAAIVRTLDGKTYEGQIYFTDAGQLLVRNSQNRNAPDRIPLTSILSAMFRTPEPDAVFATPGRWVGRDLGQASIAGFARFAGAVATLRASGSDIGGTADSGYFVYQLMDGDCQIVARLASFEQTHRDAKAGLMIRASMEPSAPCAAMLARGDGQTRFQSRARLGAAAVAADPGHPGAPCWLRLQRRGDEFKGFISADGENWDLVCTQTIAMAPRVLVGLTACSHNIRAVCTAGFERVSAAASDVAQADSTEPPSKGILLRRGSLLSVRVQAFDGSMVRLQDPQRAIPAAEVARILYKPLRADLARKLLPGQTGILLVNGDFLEGEVLGIEGQRVKLSSVLFGLRNEEIYKVAAIILHDPAPVPTQYEIRLRSGSVLFVDDLTTEKDLLIVHDPSLGQAPLHTSSILELRAGMARFTSLLDLKPVRSENPGGQVILDGAVAAVPMCLGGRPCLHGVGLSGGSSITYALDGAYRILVFRCGVPAGILPTFPVRFVVRADGREIFRSTPRTGLDEPLSATMNVTGVKTLQLGVEAPDGTDWGASGLFGDPALIK